MIMESGYGLSSDDLRFDLRPFLQVKLRGQRSILMKMFNIYFAFVMCRDVFTHPHCPHCLHWLFTVTFLALKLTLYLLSKLKIWYKENFNDAVKIGRSGISCIFRYLFICTFKMGRALILGGLLIKLIWYYPVED